MAATYDFHTLSPLDFEELSRDLLQAHWGITLESFGPGPDTGIDVRYVDGPNHLVVQAKHYLGSGFSGLCAVMAKEDAKIAKLSPSRYVLTTSVSLNPQRKQKIRETVKALDIAEPDIFGQEDLNNLLGVHSDIEKKHFKLWLSSASVLERILHSGVYNRTAAEMDIIKNLIPRFVTNKSVQEAEAVLAETGALIVAGPPGVGKTTLARILLWLHAEQGWNIFVVDDLDDAFKVAEVNEKRLILFDDFLGQVRLSNDLVRGVDARIPALFSRVKTHENLRFILTTRDYILAQARGLSAKLDRDRMDAREYVLNVGTYTRAVRARILYNHLYFSSLSPDRRDEVLEDDFFLKIVDHPNFNPRLVSLVTDPEYLALRSSTIRETIEAALTRPREIWDRPYRQHISSLGRALMIALFMNGRSAGVGQLKGSFVRVAHALSITLPPAEIEASFRSTFRELDGSVMSVIGQTVVFTNPGITDYLQDVLAADNLFPLLIDHLGTENEFRQLLESFAASKPSIQELERTAPGWSQAFIRLDEDGQFDWHSFLTLAIRLHELLRTEEALAFVRRGIEEYEEIDLEEDDLKHAGDLLERAHALELPFDLDDTFKTAGTRKLCEGLARHAWRLTFEDIESYDEILFTYGNDQDAAEQAVHEAMDEYLNGLDDELSNMDCVEDLEEFESNLLTFLRKRKYPTIKVEKDIDYKRDDLYENGRVERTGNYSSPSGISSGSSEISDDEIRSMFDSLKSG